MIESDVPQVALNLLRVDDRRDLAQVAMTDGAYGHVEFEDFGQHLGPCVVLDLPLVCRRAVRPLCCSGIVILFSNWKPFFTVGFGAMSLRYAELGANTPDQRTR